MLVRYIGKKDTYAFERGKTYKVLGIEDGWYRVDTEFGEDYLFKPEIFEVVSKQT